MRDTVQKQFLLCKIYSSFLNMAIKGWLRRSIICVMQRVLLFCGWIILPLVLFSGLNSCSFDPDTGVSLEDFFSTNPDEYAWQYKKDMPLGLYAPAIYKSGAYVYFNGGESVSGPSKNTYRYHIHNDQWQKLSKSLSARVNALSFGYGDYFYVYGGTTGSSPFDVMERYHMDTDLWQRYNPHLDFWEAYDFNTDSFTLTSEDGAIEIDYSILTREWEWENLNTGLKEIFNPDNPNDPDNPKVITITRPDNSITLWYDYDQYEWKWENSQTQEQGNYDAVLGWQVYNSSTDDYTPYPGAFPFDITFTYDSINNIWSWSFSEETYERFFTIPSKGMTIENAGLDYLQFDAGVMIWQWANITGEETVWTNLAADTSLSSYESNFPNIAYSCVSVYDHYAFAFGGHIGSETYSSSIYIYNIEANSWSLSTVPLPDGVNKHACVKASDTQTLITGGEAVEAEETITRLSCFAFDYNEYQASGSNIFQVYSDLKTSRSEHTMGYTSGEIFVLGGFSRDLDSMVLDGESNLLVENTWCQLPNLIHPAIGAQAVYTGSDSIHYFGGKLDNEMISHYNTVLLLNRLTQDCQQ